MLELINKYRKLFWKPKTMFYLGMITIIPFLILAVASYFEWGLLGMFDDWIGREVHDERDSLLTILFTLITRVGDGWFVALFTLIVSTVILFKFKNKWLSIWYFLTVALGAGGLNQILKFIFKRERPSDVEHLISQGGYSFPSGHAMGSMIVYGALIFLFIRLARKKITYVAATVGFGALVALIGISRVYLGVHYPSDIIGGYSVGLMWIAFSIGMYGLSLTRRPEMDRLEE
ncbi:phosphatase PAP2 family protein [Marinilactibacillus psychrotolerans]|uniref:Membrane-associated phospholipid phosphatase n=2 Tax=Marinilactibacillus psychrotolerans TaxID=191770 RepID=A0A511H2I7_9LACT|nr:phosphatase PAP2 family protein [Marinilactibacillus psychrotolerans]TLQ06725.1 phosphatase PAP2 family protein [Marinilactibacillus psychrotolerans]SDC69464.1 undecaprenyl-diphosphatase [Marinilactibacillus psychrotolerans]SJN43917.1 Membrane-associated phospholipid phosphatase [Marinilactibacillus psychrotolerans 42ea]GEL67741.1 hypothetical protein MPS01_18960 [Marinilactibacillus psychrotolerans]GEQ32368.1 membrane-associated phospholipid phosphatase [Marinilactibacillus psychrotolerans